MGAHFASYMEARAKLKELLDAAERGRSATVRRDDRTSAVVVCLSNPQVVREAGGWSVFIPGLPVATDGSTFDEAIDEMIDSLREYAEDWQDHLLNAANYRDNWALVQMVCLSSDDQLREWLTGGPLLQR